MVKQDFITHYESLFISGTNQNFSWTNVTKSNDKIANTSFSWHTSLCIIKFVVWHARNTCENLKYHNGFANCFSWGEKDWMMMLERKGCGQCTRYCARKTMNFVWKAGGKTSCGKSNCRWCWSIQMSFSFFPIKCESPRQDYLLNSSVL